MRDLRLQLFILGRQVGILFRQRIDPARQIRVLLLNVCQLPLQLIILLPSLRVLTRRQRQRKTRRQQQLHYAFFPHSFSHSLGDWLRECPYVVASSVPRHKPRPEDPTSMTKTSHIPAFVTAKRVHRYDSRKRDMARRSALPGSSSTRHSSLKIIVARVFGS